MNAFKNPYTESHDLEGVSGASSTLRSILLAGVSGSSFIRRFT